MANSRAPAPVTTDEMVDAAFYLEKVSIADDSEDGYEYEEVPADDDWSITEGDDDLENTVKAISEQTDNTQAADQRAALAKQPVSHKPEAVDDFLRNFLIKMGMSKTLDCFQTEWYEMTYRGLLNAEQVGFVPDVYSHNQHLENEIKSLKKEQGTYKRAALKAGDVLVKLRKERDFHRMQHKRVVQEKNRLISDIKRLKKHYASYEPALRQLQDKYKTALKHKMLTSLERDRAAGQITGLQATLRNIQPEQQMTPLSTAIQRPCREASGAQGGCRQKQESREKMLLTDLVAPYDPAKDPTKQTVNKYPDDSEFPLDTRVNPNLAQVKGQASHVTRSSGYRLTNTLKVHELAVSSLAAHPRKQIVVTTSDDCHWKMWSVPNGDIIMAGEGHSDWLSSCCFHPEGNKLATTSGDTTVKIWDFSKGECVLTFEGHTHAVWGCSWHSCGDFLASCSMDNTSKIWDLNSKRCRYTLRGHADSVNSVEFLPFSNTLLTSSADKTLSLWDARTGLCAQTFYGHLHSCNHATFNLTGDTVVSCDSYGVVKLWDVRKVAAMLTVDTGPHPSNCATFDLSGRLVAIASNDGAVKLLDLASGQVSSLLGHEDAVQSVIYDCKGEFLLSGSSDGTVQIWS
ncbi:sperm-associated antigen 16 protein-like [Acipenser ruthenus]|uniref:sperm-associated antigen 16 protein-like n=1 Tax=Acipenser ruthenus TaxID=7906 RepID=UPI0027420206|nr:sperm-associated antigen 16 protein-like [Acipenser ruthenus]